MTAAHTDTEREIVRLVDAQIDGWNRGDAEAYASNSGGDLSFTNIRGQRWVGRQPFVDVHRRILGGVYAGSHLEATYESIDQLTSDVVAVHLLLVLHGALGMPAGITAAADGTLRTRLLQLFVRRDGAWTLVAVHNTPVLS